MKSYIENPHLLSSKEVLTILEGLNAWGIQYDEAGEAALEDEDAEIDPDAELDAAIAEEESLNQDKPTI